MPLLISCRPDADDLSSMDRHGDPCIPSPRGPHSRSRLSPNPFCPGVVVVFSLSFSFLLGGGGGGRAGLAAAVKRRSRPPVRIKTNVPKKSYPAAAAAAQKAAGAGELLYEVLAGGRAGRGRVTGDGRTNAGCVASCEKKGSEQAGEGTNERTSERRRKRRRKLLQRRRRRNRLLASKEKTEREAAAAAARQFCDVWRPAKFRRESVEKSRGKYVILPFRIECVAANIAGLIMIYE